MKKLLIPCLLAVALMSLPACKDKNSAENAGEELDKAAEKAKDKMEEGAKKVGEAAEKAGDKIKDATK